MEIMQLWKELEKFVIQFDESRRQIDYILRYYQNTCKKLIQSLKTVSLAESEAIFSQLYEITQHISQIRYGYDIEISGFLENLIYHFERLDDKDYREFLYHHFQRSSDWPNT